MESYMMKLGKLIAAYHAAVDAESRAKKREYNALMASLEAQRNRYNAEVALDEHRRNFRNYEND